MNRINITIFFLIVLLFLRKITFPQVCYSETAAIGVELVYDALTTRFRGWVLGIKNEKWCIKKKEMDTITIVTLLAIGMIAGAFGGLFGVGGAVIMIPAMVYILGVDQHMAQGTSLAVMLPPVGLFAAYNYYKAGEVNVWYAAIIAVAFLIGGFFGSKVALLLPEYLMKKIFAVFLILLALKILFSKQAGIPE